MKILDKMTGSGRIWFQVPLEEDVTEGQNITVDGQNYHVEKVELLSILTDPPILHSKLLHIKQKPGEDVL